ncbi:PEP-CTERM sorting domain-containing protein [uncultured Desulfobacter sp.]|uniref:PEP-CTERM sorting domain-containing protein n=1 Tax=uncultured Desulfobacter sp. TaxID=240139 RepID=UPI002AA661D6|nr:PEP-CTERM sorting domain-containing protein [uncultured Desulfobacter sp.]
MALFENNADFDWGVFDASDLPERMNIKEGSITVSHVTEFVSNGGTIDVDPVPEPSTFLLFGAGLLGLAKLSRRKK